VVTPAFITIPRYQAIPPSTRAPKEQATIFHVGEVTKMNSVFPIGLGGGRWVILTLSERSLFFQVDSQRFYSIIPFCSRLKTGSSDFSYAILTPTRQQDFTFSILYILGMTVI
jgi:hypothetical protein